MSYRYWTFHGVRPKKGDMKWKGGTVAHSRGNESSSDADLRHVRKIDKLNDGSDNSRLLVALVDGKAVIINDREFYKERVQGTSWDGAPAAGHHER
jgi:hypothetical protein